MKDKDKENDNEEKEKEKEFNNTTIVLSKVNNTIHIKKEKEK
jgi:hypothetical protein